MYIYWRAKTWKLASASGTVNFAEDVVWSFNVGETTIGSMYGVTTEEQLVCDQTFSNAVLIPVEIQSPEGSNTYMVQLGMVYFPIISRSGQDYQMSFKLSTFFAGNTNISTNPEDFGESNQCGSLTLNPLELTIPLYTGGEGGNLQMQIAPVEWWGYGGTWNTSTGQPA